MRMKFLHVTPLLTILVLSHLSKHVTGERFYIIPSPDSSCPEISTAGESCFTLQQYISTQNFPARTNITLELQPGNHTLETDLIVSDLMSFAMKGINSSLYYCDTQFSFSNVDRVHISDMEFINCGYEPNGKLQQNNIDTVGSFVLENSIFVSGNGLYITRSPIVEILNTTFTGAIGSALCISRSSAIVRQCKFSNTVRNIVRRGNARTFFSGALCINKVSSLTIEESEFKNNELAIRGQASKSVILKSTFISNTKGTISLFIRERESIEISDCTFINNTRTNGGAIATNGNGVDSIVTVTKCFFMQNKATQAGGAIYLGRGRFNNVQRTNFSIANSTFLYNMAQSSAVLDSQFSEDNLISIQNSTFSHNSALRDGGVMQIERTTLLISDSLFHNNSAVNDGGVITTKLSPIVLSVSTSTFTSNRAGDDGGALYIGRSSTLSFSDNLFDSNHGTDRGGAIAASGSILRVNDTTFIDNEAESGEAISACNSDVELSDVYDLSPIIDPKVPLCVQYNNANSTQDANVTIISPSVDLVNQEVNKYYIIPSVESPCPGEVIGMPCLVLDHFVTQVQRYLKSNTLTFEVVPGTHVFNSKLQVRDINLFTMSGSNNTTILCNCTKECGRFFSSQFNFYNVANVSLNGMNFINCAGMYTFRAESFVFKDSSFQTEQSLDIRLSSALIVNSSFILVNKGPEDTLLITHSATLTVRESTFSKRKGLSVRRGGAIHAIDTTVTIESSKFDRNIGQGRSGGVHVINRNGAPVTLTNCTFVHNTVDDFLRVRNGGAVHLEGGSLVVSSCTFTGNRASNGGAIFVRNSTSVAIHHSNFIGNFARDGRARSQGTDPVGRGGVLHLRRHKDGTNISIFNTTFSDNFALHCGVLDLDNVEVKLDTSTFTRNVAYFKIASDNEGGVACINHTNLSVLKSTFSHNLAMGAGDGGVMHVMRMSTITVNESKFENNTAGRHGGVISADVDRVTLSFGQSLFHNNTATVDGGVAHVGGAGSQVATDLCTFDHNKAFNRGGVLDVRESLVNIVETSFFNNTANLGGVISACDSEVTLSNELFVTADPTEPMCTLYDDSITTTTSAPTKVTTTVPQTETNTTTAQTEPSTTATQTEANTTTAQTEPSTTATQTEEITTTTQAQPYTITTQTEPSTTATHIEASTTDAQTEASTTDVQTEPSTTATQTEVSTTTARTEPSTTATQTEEITTTTQTQPYTITTQTEPSTTATHTETNTTDAQTEASASHDAGTTTAQSIVSNNITTEYEATTKIRASTFAQTETSTIPSSSSSPDSASGMKGSRNNSKREVMDLSLIIILSLFSQLLY